MPEREGRCDANILCALAVPLAVAVLSLHVPYFAARAASPSFSIGGGEVEEASAAREGEADEEEAGEEEDEGAG